MYMYFMLLSSWCVSSSLVSTLHVPISTWIISRGRRETLKIVPYTCMLYLLHFSTPSFCFGYNVSILCTHLLPLLFLSLSPRHAQYVGQSTREQSMISLKWATRDQLWSELFTPASTTQTEPQSTFSLYVMSLKAQYTCNTHVQYCQWMSLEFWESHLSLCNSRIPRFWCDV